MVVTESGCWQWVGALRPDGYGLVYDKHLKKLQRAHRAAYAILVAPVEPGLHLDHLCRNRACINPEHLALVSHAENMTLDKDARDTCKAGHPWTDENTYVTFVKRKQGGIRPQRYCRVCRAQHQADLRERRKQTNPKRTT